LLDFAETASGFSELASFKSAGLELGSGDSEAEDEEMSFSRFT